MPYDKIGDPQSLNLYTYLLDNPLSAVDPDGHAGLCGHRSQGCTQPNMVPKHKGTVHQAQQQTSAPKQPSKTTPLPAGVAGRLLPGANGAAQAAKQATKGVPKESPRPIPSEDPGPDLRPAEFSLKPGEIPKVGPDAPLAQRIGIGALNAVKLIGQFFGHGAADIIPPMFLPKTV